MKQEDTRHVGQAVMAGAGLSVFLFLLGVVRRSYAVLAIPVFAGLTAAAGLAFWVGYTMATTNWDNPDDFGVEPTDGDGHAPTGAGDSTS